MEFSQYFLILNARKWVAIIVLGLTVLITAIVSLVLPKSYTATTSLVVNFKGTDPVTGLTLPAALLPGYMPTQVDIITSHKVALKVVDTLQIANNPQAKQQFMQATKGAGDIRDWYADKFLQSLSVEPSKQSSVIQINYKGSDPRFAAALANAFAQAYIDTSISLKVEPSKQAASWFNEKIKGLKQNLETAQGKLSAYQRDHGIVFADERLDVETARLAELSSQLVGAQSLTYESRSKQQQLNQGKASEAPDIIANPLIQGLKSQLVQAEAKLSDLSQRLDKQHPQYLSAQMDVDHLHKRIEEETAKLTSSIGQTTRVSQQRESEIKSALAAQKSRVLELKKQHDDLAVLTRDVENAQHFYESAVQRYGQTSMEGDANQTDLAILNSAVAPLEPSSPKLLRNLLVAVFVGTLLGIGLCFLLEMLDRRVRSAEDVTNILGLLVVGTLSSQPKTGKVNFLNTLIFNRLLSRPA